MRGVCRLNPTFGLASLLVGGADADFQINSSLYELKTVRKAGLTSDHYHQLIGYSALNFFNNGPLITELAVYFSRFGKTVHWPAPNWTDSTHEPFLLWFCRAADEQFGMGFPLSDVGNPFVQGSAIQPKIQMLATEFAHKTIKRNEKM